MVETFVCQGRTWTRRAFPDIPVNVMRRESKGRYCPTVSVAWAGKHLLSDGERELTVEKSTVHDAGKFGASLTYSGVYSRPKGMEFDNALSQMGWRRGA